MWHDHESLFRLIDQHLGWYPSMEPRDVYKLLYQGVRGPEHIIGSEAAFREGLLAEFAPLEARQQFQGTRPAYVPAPDAEETARRNLAAHLNPDGTIRQIPRQAGKLRVILNYLINAFEVGRVYTEKEINAILKRFNEDVSGLRRDLVDAGLLARERDGSRYWRK